MDRSVVLVTGASRGIGRATAQLLAERGYQVFGTARNPAANEIEGVRMVPLDVTDQASVTGCVAAVQDRAGHLDVLVNNAAAGLIGAVEETALSEARSLFETNFFGAARMVNAVLPGMRDQRNGLIVNLGSLAAGLPIPFHAYLSCSKAAVNTYSDALRLEVKGLGIAVTVVEPGATATHPGDLFTQLKVAGSIDDYAEQERRAVAVIAHSQRAGGDPQRVARTILRILRTEAPARYYLVGTERWYARLSRILPPSVIESAVTRHFHLSA